MEQGLRISYIENTYIAPEKKKVPHVILSPTANFSMHSPKNLNPRSNGLLLWNSLHS